MRGACGACCDVVALDLWEELVACLDENEQKPLPLAGSPVLLCVALYVPGAHVTAGPPQNRPTSRVCRDLRLIG